MALESDGAANAATAPRTRRMWRVLEAAALIAGLVCLAVYGAGMLHRSLGASLALNRFDAKVAKPPHSRPVQSVDFSLWSRKRIKGYLSSLTALKGDPLAVLSIGRLNVRAAVSGTHRP